MEIVTEIPNVDQEDMLIFIDELRNRIADGEITGVACVYTVRGGVGYGVRNMGGLTLSGAGAVLTDVGLRALSHG